MEIVQAAVRIGKGRPPERFQEDRQERPTKLDSSTALPEEESEAGKETTKDKSEENTVNDETYYQMETWDGYLVSVPSSKLDSWLAEQKKQEEEEKEKEKLEQEKSKEAESEEKDNSQDLPEKRNTEKKKMSPGDQAMLDDMDKKIDWEELTARLEALEKKGLM